MRLRIREEHRAMPAYEKPPAWRVDVYLFLLLFFGFMSYNRFVNTVEVIL